MLVAESVSLQSFCTYTSSTNLVLSRRLCLVWRQTLHLHQLPLLGASPQQPHGLQPQELAAYPLTAVQVSCLQPTKPTALMTCGLRHLPATPAALSELFSYQHQQDHRC